MKPFEASSADSAARTMDLISTRVISEQLVVDGVKFDWWAVGDGTYLVTVRNSDCGSLAEFSRGDPAEFAVTLARKVLAQHREQAAKLSEDPDPERPADGMEG